MLAFEIALHGRPETVTPGADLTDAWGTWPTVTVPPATLADPMVILFDDAIGRLAAIERLYVEPDGSFVWASGRRDEVAGRDWWQIDGNAFDRDGRVVVVDLKGSCPPEAFDRVIAAFGWPGQRLLMQLVRSAALLEESVFRRHATARGLAKDGERLRPR